MNDLLFLALPYASIALFVAVTILRFRQRPFTVSSLSSQLLEGKRLYWGSIPFHWGVVLILLGHLAALLVPRGILWWNAVPARVYLLEGTGAALAVWALIGLLVLTWRRLSHPRIRAVSTPMDYVVLALLLIQLATGLWTAASYRFGSSWFAGVMTPYLWSILTLRPRPDLMLDLMWPVKIHVLGFFVLLAALPFSRLVHIVTLPLGYLVRPWQIVVWTQRRARRRRT
ncbi:MAG: respiratory nitrate reductase subunit gamma [Deinococcales bacterium]